MKLEVKCMFCGKIWKSEDPEDFLTTCGVCKKTLMTYFESQFLQKLLKARVLRVENK